MQSKYQHGSSPYYFTPNESSYYMSYMRIISSCISSSLDDSRYSHIS